MDKKLYEKKCGRLSLAALCLAIAMLFCTSACMVGKEARGDDAKQGQSFTIKATIDNQCRSHPKAFTVPAGKSAHSFKSGGLKAGAACHEGGAPENKGFAIRDAKNRPVYMWSQYKNQAPYEKGGPLSSLSLNAGEYTLSVAGGAGAEIELSYKLK